MLTDMRFLITGVVTTDSIAFVTAAVPNSSVTRRTTGLQ